MAPKEEDHAASATIIMELNDSVQEAVTHGINDAKDKIDTEESSNRSEPSNEYVLNVAFFSFLAFVVFQAVFAIIAKSQAMLADSEAMTVDALTYLFNLCAERIKNRPLQPDELDLPEHVRQHRRELRRLYLELIPPTISVITLVAVTVVTLREALSTLVGDVDGEDDDDVSVSLMLIFSGANLLLDIVNVTCFARAHAAFGLDVVRQENDTIRRSIQHARRASSSATVGEGTALLQRTDVESQHTTMESSYTDDDEFYNEASDRPCDQTRELVNLNMCSAWTVSSLQRVHESSVVSLLRCTLLAHTRESLFHPSFSTACLRRHAAIHCSSRGCCYGIFGTLCGRCRG